MRRTPVSAPFTPDELAANRSGVMTSAQARRLRRGPIYLIGAIRFVVLALMSILFALIALAVLVPSTDTVGLVMGIIWIVGIGAVWFYYIRLWRRMWQDAAAGAVAVAEGTVFWQYMGRRPALVVRSNVYQFTELHYLFRNRRAIDISRTYRVYYSPRSKVLLSFETIG